MQNAFMEVNLLVFDIAFDGTWELLEFLKKQESLDGNTPGLRLVARITRPNDESNIDGPCITFFLDWIGEDGQQEHTVGVERLPLDDFKAFAKAVHAFKS